MLSFFGFILFLLIRLHYIENFYPPYLMEHRKTGTRFSPAPVSKHTKLVSIFILRHQGLVLINSFACIFHVGSNINNIFWSMEISLFLQDNTMFHRKFPPA